MDGEAEAVEIIKLAAQQGLLSEAEAVKWLARLGDLRLGDVGGQWLVAQGALTPEQLARLSTQVQRAAARTADGLAPVSGSAGEPHGRDLRASGPVIPGYEILDVIGSGGMGVVYRARQHRPRRTVAIKLLKAGGFAGEAQRRRFEREGQAASDLSHPGIVTIYEFGEVEGQPFFTMELVDGKHLDQYAGEAALSFREKLLLMQRVCEAVAYAHQHGVIHRDLKPANVLVTAAGKPKVLDFGLAKVSGPVERESLRALTLDGQVLGTLPYMAPEQTLGQAGGIDVRTDVYALGVVFYELLTGRLPHEPAGESVLTVMRRIREEPPRAPSTISREVGDEVETIILKALEKDKDRRYQSAEALGADIGRYLAGQPIEAKRASVLYQVRKLAYRYRLLLIPSALALAVVVGVFVYSFLRVRAERNVAVAAKAAEEKQRWAAEKAREEAVRESYYNTIALAKRRIDDLDYGQALALLARAPASHRNWEWGRFMYLCQRDALTLRGHLKTVAGVAFSPDGQRIATACFDGTARIWDAADGNELLLLQGHTNTVNSIAFSPDGRRVVTSSGDHTAKVWDAATGAALLTLQGHSDRVPSLALSPDGRLIVTASFDGTAKVWDAATGVERVTFTKHSDRLTSVDFSRDGKQVVTGGFDGTARVWSPATGEQTWMAQGGSAGDAVCAAFSPDGLRVVTGSSTGQVRICKLAGGEQPLEFNTRSGWVIGLAFSPNGRHVVTCSPSKTVGIWDAASGKRVAELKGHSGWVSSAAFSPDGNWLITGSEDATAKVWDIGTAADFRELHGHSAAIGDVTFSRDGRLLATASHDGTVLVWDVATDKAIRKLKGHSGPVTAAAFSPDGKLIATGSFDRTAGVWQLNSAKKIGSLTGHAAGVDAVTFEPGGHAVLTGSLDGSVRFWDFAAQKCTRTLSGHSKAVGAIALTPDGGRQAVTDAVTAISISPDGRLLATASYDRTAIVWDYATGAKLVTLKGHRDAVSSLAFSPDGRRLATGSHDKTARVWDVESGGPLLVLSGHTNGVLDVAFSPDGRRIATASSDRTAKLWDAQTGRELLSMHEHWHDVLSVDFSPDGRVLATASNDKTVKLREAIDWHRSLDEIERAKLQRWREGRQTRTHEERTGD